MIRATPRRQPRPPVPLVVGAESLESRTLLNAADPDPSFGRGGVVYPPGYDVVGGSNSMAVAFAAGGKVVVGGSGAFTGYDPNTSPAVARFNADGSLDSSFGGDGWADLGDPYRSSAPADQVTAVAVQPDDKVLLGQRASVARLNADGTRDAAFAGNGSFTLPGAAASHGGVAEVKVLADRRILAIGGLHSVWVARLNADGTPDPTFGTAGVAYADANIGVDVLELPQDVTMDSAGRVVVVGRTNSTAAGDHAFVVRFDQTGRPDTTFGGGGGVATLDLAQSAAFAVRMLPDGSVFVAGSAPAGVFLAHVLPDGTADTSFGAGGYRLAAEPAGTPIPASSFRSMEFMDDGRFVAAATYDDATVRRYLADGTLDTSYGAGGEARSRSLPNATAAPYVAVSPQGETAVAVQFYPFADPHTPAAVARFTPDGQPDAAFAGGVATANYFASQPPTLSRLGESLDGHLLAAGQFGDLLVVGRFNRDGSADTSFDSDGYVTRQVPGGFGAVSSFQVLPDGTLLLGSTRPAADSAPPSFLLIRLNDDGTFDNSFGTGGVVATPLPGGNGTQSTVVATALQPDGKIVATGGLAAAKGESASRFVTARYNADGSLDAGFASGGVAVTDVDPSPSAEGPADVAVLSDGTILVAGTALGQWAFVRYAPDGTPDEQFDAPFNQPGVKLFSPGGGGGAAADVLALPAGGFLAAGSAAANDYAVARFHFDGTPDAAFGDDGVALAGFTNSAASSVRPLRLDRQQDGKILVAGGSPEDGVSFAAARFNAEGSPDTAFGSGGRWLGSTGTQAADVVLMSDGGIVFVSVSLAAEMIRLKGDSPAALTPTARNVFYNDSAFDGGNPGVSGIENFAIAPDKDALLPGQAATFSNVTSYSKGINGVMVELSGIPPAELLPGDFIFLTGRTGNPSAWPEAPAPVWVAPVPAAGGDVAARYAMTWGADAVRNNWLQVTVKANARTGLAAPDVFYFGNLVGETGDDPALPLVVSQADYAQARANLGQRNVPATNRFDFDRNGQVDVRDLAALRGNLSRALPPPPPGGGAAFAAKGASYAGRRRSAYQALAGD